MGKRITAVVIAIFLVLGVSACEGAKKETAVAFQETDMGKASGLAWVGGIRLDSRDQMVAYTATEQGGQRYAVLDKDGREVRSIPCEFNGDGGTFTLDAKDNLYALAQSLTFDESGKTIKEIARQVVVYNSEGVKQKTTDLGKIVPDNGYTDISGFEADQEGNVYLLNRGKPVEVYDKDGRSLGTIGSQGYDCMCMDGEGNLILGSNGQGGGNNAMTLEKIKTPKGESVWKKDPGFSDVPTIIRYSRSDKCIYTLTNRGVRKYAPDGTVKGDVLDIKKTSLSGFNSYPTGMCVDSAGSFFFTVFLNNEGGGSGKVTTGFYKYAPGEGVSSDSQEKKLVLNAMESNRYLESAISEFEKNNPGIRIEVKGITSVSNADDYNKYVTTLNTELMSNKGPDLVEAGSLPNYKYISKGIYANLSDRMAGDKEIDLKQYNTNLFDSFKYKGSLYTMPCSVFLETMAVNQNILKEEQISIDDTKWTWKEFLEICKKVTRDTNGDGTPERYALPYMETRSILNNMFRNSSSQFIDRENKKAHLDSPEFIELLKTAKEFSDSKVTCPDKKATTMSTDLFELYDRNGVVFVPATLYAYGTMGFYGESTAFLQPPSVSGAYKPQYTTWLMLAVNDKSKYRDEAWKFLKFLISKEMQGKWELNGFVFNKEATVSRRQTEIERTKDGKSTGFSGRRILPMTDALLDSADRLASIPGFMPDYDQQISKLIFTEAENFFTGKKTAEDAAKAMQNRIETYLNE